MAAAIVSTHLIEDLLLEADPALENSSSSAIRALVVSVRPRLNAVVKGLRHPSHLDRIIARERSRADEGGPVCAAAFATFVATVLECLSDQPAQRCAP